MTTWPFNANVPRHQWVDITADGFAGSVNGCVYDGHRLDGGVPLGGLGTGYFTLEGTGKVGFCSIFNDIVPPRRDFAEWLTVCLGEYERLPLSIAEIAYWGHYPFADMVCQFARKQLTLGIRAFAPVVLGNQKDSNIPAVLFEIAVQNTGSVDQEVTLVITPPSPPYSRNAATTMVGDDLRFASGKGTISKVVRAGEAVHVRFVFAWYAPYWRDSGNEAHVHQYSVRYADAEAVAADAFARFDALRDAVLRWQQVIYAAEWPGWLCDALIQGLYSLAKNTVWIARTRKDEWWSDIGWFTHNESHTGCPITETMVCRMHGHFPVLMFYPELEASTLDAFRHFQISDGEVPFSFGMNTSLRDPRYHCQHPLNSGQYAQMVYRLYQRTGDADLLAQFYDSARRAIRYQYTLDDDDDGLVNDQAHVQPGELWPANQFYDIWPWWGTSAYVAGTWLATLACGQAMAVAMGDTDFAAECQDWLERGQTAYQEKLWTGEYYRLWADPENKAGQGQHSDVSLGNQLMAQWCVKVAGLAEVLPGAQIASALGAVARLNMPLTQHGIINGATPQGTRFASKSDSDEHVVAIDEATDFASQIFVGETLCAAMTFIYHGETDTGLEIAKRLYEAVALQSCSPWNQRCLIDSDSGLPVWGDDYYSNMVVWALPMALGGQGIGEFVGSAFLTQLIKVSDV